MLSKSAFCRPKRGREADARAPSFIAVTSLQELVHRFQEAFVVSGTCDGQLVCSMLAAWPSEPRASSAAFWVTG